MAWTKITKPSIQAWTNIDNPVHEKEVTYEGGEPIGMLLALTYTTIILVDPWVKVAKPTLYSWTNVAKPTD